jgi:hypothetical protein
LQTHEPFSGVPAPNRHISQQMKAKQQEKIKEEKIKLKREMKCILSPKAYLNTWIDQNKTL